VLKLPIARVTAIGCDLGRACSLNGPPTSTIIVLMGKIFSLGGFMLAYVLQMTYSLTFEYGVYTVLEIALGSGL